MPKYRYSGPVMQFDQIINRHWIEETIAPTPGKAKSNLAFQFKMQNKRAAGAKITLPGSLQEVE